MSANSAAEPFLGESIAQQLLSFPLLRSGLALCQGCGMEQDNSAAANTFMAIALGRMHVL